MKEKRQGLISKGISGIGSGIINTGIYLSINQYL
jgi:hypothetical protein